MKRIAVVGNGLAAISFILQLPEAVQVILVAGEGPMVSNSYMAKGGIAVSKSLSDKEVHMHDTQVAGAFMGNETIIKDVIFGSEAVFIWLQKQGLQFDPKPSREGGHSINRIEHISDQTGKYLVQHLWEKLRSERKIILLEHHYALELLLENHTCIGLKVGDKAHAKVYDIHAAAVVLATGGCGNLYERNTNASGANGEGIGLANTAGAELSHMEFIQFHPTKLFDPSGRRNILVTEAFRGAGAVVTNANKEDFLLEQHPLGSLAPRDVVSLGMYHQMELANVPYLRLDFSKVAEEKFKTNFPFLYEEVCEEPYFKQQWIPVTPAAHYQCGGIKVDANSESTIKRLFAIGEVAYTGLHGANRLASNSLLELFHFSSQLAQYLTPLITDSEFSWRSEPKTIDTHMPQLSLYMNELHGIMWHYFGIVRSTTKMMEGIEKLKVLTQMVEKNPEASIEKYRMLNRLTCAKIIAQAALVRTESLGCHQVQNH